LTHIPINKINIIIILVIIFKLSNDDRLTFEYFRSVVAKLLTILKMYKRHVVSRLNYIIHRIAILKILKENTYREILGVTRVTCLLKAAATDGGRKKRGKEREGRRKFSG